MKLNVDEFFPKVTNLGVEHLYSFCEAIIRKRLPTVNNYDLEEIKQSAVLRCLNKLKDYDSLKNNQLGGYLYSQVVGAITLFLYNQKKHQIVADENQIINIKVEEKIEHNLDYSSILKFYDVSPKYNKLIGDIVRAIMECEDAKEKKEAIKMFKKTLRKGWYS